MGDVTLSDILHNNIDYIKYSHYKVMHRTIKFFFSYIQVHSSVALLQIYYSSVLNTDYVFKYVLTMNSNMVFMLIILSSLG